MFYAWTGYAILSRRLEVPPGPITVVTQLQSRPFGNLRRDDFRKLCLRLARIGMRGERAGTAPLG
jgi:hypothetical protein